MVTFIRKFEFKDCIILIIWTVLLYFIFIDYYPRNKETETMLQYYSENVSINKDCTLKIINIDTLVCTMHPCKFLHSRIFN